MFAASALALSNVSIAQDFFKQLQDRLGVTEDSSSPSPDPESLPSPIVEPKSSSTAPDTNEGIPAVTPVPSPFLPDVIATDEATEQPSQTDRPYLGVTVEQLSGGGMGLRVVEVTREGPGWKSKITPGDILLAVDDVAVSSLDQLANLILSHQPSDKIVCLIDRNGRTMKVPVILASAILSERSGIKPASPITPGAYQPIGPSLELESQDTPIEPEVTQRASLGITIYRLSEALRQRYGIPVNRGAVVASVIAGSPAERGGLLPGDCIVEIDGAVMQSDVDVSNWVMATAPGTVANIRYFRGRDLQSVRIRLEPSTQPLQADATTRMRPNNQAPQNTNEIDRLETQIQSLEGQLRRAQAELDALRGTR
jgi:S1-C subfamily serine protease